MRRSSSLGSWVVIAAILCLWEVLPQLGLIQPLFLPPLSQALEFLWSHRGELLAALLVTLLEIAAAYLFACGAAILLGMYVGSRPSLVREVSPWLRSAYAVPLITMYPAFMVWFGLGSASKIAFAAVYAFIPTFLSASAGVRSIDGRFVMLSRALDASTRQHVFWVLLPASLPVIIAALRLGGAIVIVGVIVSEMLGSLAGLGSIITRERTVLNSAGVYAGILVVLAITASHELVLQGASRLTGRFQLE